MSAKRFMRFIQPHLRGISKWPYPHVTKPRRFTAVKAGARFGEKRVTWSIWFSIRVPEHLDFFPDYIEVLVDDLTGEAWQEAWQEAQQMKSRARPSAASWRTPPRRK